MIVKGIIIVIEIVIKREEIKTGKDFVKNEIEMIVTEDTEIKVHKEVAEVLIMIVVHTETEVLAGNIAGIIIVQAEIRNINTRGTNIDKL